MACRILSLLMTPNDHQDPFYPSVTTLRSGLCYRLPSGTFVRPTQAVETFCNISSPFCTFAIFDLRAKFYGERPR